MSEHKTMPVSISQAIIDIIDDIEKLEQSSTNDFQKFNYASIDKFLEMINPLFAKHGLFIIQNEINNEIVPTEGKGILIKYTYEFILCSKKGEIYSENFRRSVITEWKGGVSSGTAQSYAIKQFYRSLFAISTGEDEGLELEKDLDKTNQKTIPNPQIKKPTEQTNKGGL